MKKKKNKIIIRRMIAGILLTILSLYTFYKSYTIFSIILEYNTIDKDLKNSIVNTSEYLFIFGILLLTIGIIFLSTSNRRPKKGLECSLVIIFLLVGALFGFITGGIISPIGKVISALASIFFVLGLPLKKGFKDMPFEEKNDARNVEENANKNSSSITSKSLVNNTKEPVKSEKSSDLNNLRDLKKLLDDGVITQDDFDAKKKQILKL